MNPELSNGIALPGSFPEMNYSLTFDANGKFSGVMRANIMVSMDFALEGTYKVSGETVTLSGTRSGKMDEGYRKSDVSEPFVMQLQLNKDFLLQSDGQQDTMKVVFRREGSPDVKVSEVFPKVQKPASSPDAVNLIKRIRSTYQGLAAYQDEGTIVSDGSGYQSKRATFKTRFTKSDRRFLFQGKSDEGFKNGGIETVWSDGRKSWLGGGSEDRKTERPIGNGLGILSVSFGSSTMIVPDLLLPDPGFNLFTALKALSAVKDQDYGGQPCKVFSGEARTQTYQFWIHAKSNLVLKVTTGRNSEVIEYEPMTPASIPEIEFKP